MKTAIPINKKLFDIFLLFTREPFVQYFTKELEFYSNGNGGLLEDFLKRFDSDGHYFEKNNQ
jgi:hypothetical protein